MTKIRDREQLIDAAAKVFGEKGFEAARLEEIAAELGILQGSLYYHVNSKADLLALVQRRRLIALIERVEEIAASELPPREKLAAAIREHLRHLDQFFPESSQWFMEPSQPRISKESRQEVLALNRHYVDVLEGIVRQGIATGVLRSDVDTGIAARAMLGMCNWLPRWYRKDGSLSIDEISDMFIGIVMNGLQRDAARL